MRSWERLPITVASEKVFFRIDYNDYVKEPRQSARLDAAGRLMAVKLRTVELKGLKIIPQFL